MRIPHTMPAGVSAAIGRAAAKTGLTPNAVTTIGFFGNIGAAVLAGAGEFVWAGLALIAASALDSVDGALARATGRATPFGAVYDAVLDRMSEAAVYIGLLYYYVDRGNTEESVLAFAALLGSIMVSYVRARAETAGFLMREGLFTRLERILVLTFGLLTGWVRLVLWILAIATNLTAAQRLYYAFRELHGVPDNSREASAPAAPSQSPDQTTGRVE
jgi:CDP-diacylglycerol--glycerol-3-phosphate 3-phosphatidyltransferase